MKAFLSIGFYALLAAGCGDRGFGVALTLTAHSSLDDSALGEATRLEIEASGDETTTRTVDLTGRGLKRVERLFIVPHESSRTLTFVLRLVGPSGVVATATDGPVALSPGATTFRDVVLQRESASDGGLLDGGAGDGGAGDGGSSLDGGPDDGDGGTLFFGNPIMLSAGTEPRALATGNVSGDPHLDLVTAEKNGLASYEWINSTYTRSTLSISSGLGTPNRLAVGNFDQDPDEIDDVVASMPTGFVSWRPGYNEPSQGVSIAGNYGGAQAQVLKDGTLAVAASGGGYVQFFHFDPAARMDPWSSIKQIADVAPRGLSLADVSGNGTIDLVTTHPGATTLSFFEGGATPLTFGVQSDPATLAGATLALAANFDTDATTDLAVLSPSAKKVRVYTNKMSQALDLTLSDEPIDFAVGDLDGDGHADLAITTKGPSLVVARSAPSSVGAFLVESMRLPSEPSGVAIGEFLDGGKNDVAIAFPTLGEIHVYPNILP